MIRKKTRRGKNTSFKALKLWFWTKNPQSRGWFTIPFLRFTLWRQIYRAPLLLLQHLTSGCFGKLIILLRFREWHHGSNRMVREYLQIMILAKRNLAGFFATPVEVVLLENLFPLVAGLSLSLMYLTWQAPDVANEFWWTCCWGFVVFTFPKTCSLSMFINSYLATPQVEFHWVFFFTGVIIWNPPKQYTKGKSFKFIIHSHCLISPNWVAISDLNGFFAMSDASFFAYWDICFAKIWPTCSMYTNPSIWMVSLPVFF